MLNVLQYESRYGYDCVRIDVCKYILIYKCIIYLLSFVYFVFKIFCRLWLDLKN